jgi:uncharacterized protein YfiM (DUF2279 family)
VRDGPADVSFIATIAAGAAKGATAGMYRRQQASWGFVLLDALGVQADATMGDLAGPLCRALSVTPDRCAVAPHDACHATD